MNSQVPRKRSCTKNEYDAPKNANLLTITVETIHVIMSMEICEMMNQPAKVVLCQVSFNVNVLTNVGELLRIARNHLVENE